MQNIVMQVIEQNTKTEKAKELYKLLLSNIDIDDNNRMETISGVLCDCSSDEKRQKMIDILNKYELSRSDISHISLDIKYGYEPEFERV